MSMFCSALLASTLFLGLAHAAPTPAPAKPAPAKPAAPPAKDAPPPAKDAPKETVSEADAKRFSAFFDKLIDIIVANQTDCTKMAAAINAHIDANAALVKEMNDPKNKDRDVPKAYKDRLNERVSKEMMPALQKKCINDKAVQAAVERFGGK